MAIETHSDATLTLKFDPDGDETIVSWEGRSNSRRPGEFILPVLESALRVSREVNKTLVLDFRELKYMNSSTVTPIIRLLEQAKKDKHRVRVIYKGGLKWQALSFSALEAFHTEEQRITIEAV